jgi:hypothetical protein
VIAARFEPGNHGMATDGAIEVARGLQLQGRMAEAEVLYRDLLGKQPDASMALEGWASCFLNKGMRRRRQPCSRAAWRSNRSRSVFMPTCGRKTGISSVALRSKLFCQSGYGGPA